MKTPGPKGSQIARLRQKTTTSWKESAYVHPRMSGGFGVRIRNNMLFFIIIRED